MALLGAIFAPQTFAAVYSSCGAAVVEPHFLEWAGRELLPHEVALLRTDIHQVRSAWTWRLGWSLLTPVRMVKRLLGRPL